MPVDLQTLINSIQVAEAGHVITEEYHNSVRAALLQIAQQLSGGVTSSQNVVLSHPPEFTQNDSGPNWSMVNGIASKDASGSANGWFRVQFPQGARILQMIVSGRRAGTTSFPFSARLLRVNISDGESLPVINLNLGGASDPFSITQTPNTPGAGPAALEEARVVDNERYSYLVTARVLGAAVPDIAQINNIRIVYNRP